MSAEAVSSENVGVLEHLDPKALEIELNVRTEKSITKQFIASVAEHGVLVPVTAVRGADGVVRVRAGQRRTLAAREAGLATIPVYIVAAASEETVDRLAMQITENDHRARLTGSERVVGIAQMLDTGLSVTKAAKALAVAPATVKNAKAVAGSKAAMDVLADRQISLADAAVIAEFDGDEPAMEQLMRNIGYSGFEHTASRLRQSREDAKLRAVEQEKYRAKGFTIIEHEDRPRWGDVSRVPIDHLSTADGEDVSDAAVAEHPAWWAVKLQEETVFVDKVSGEPVDEETIDWATEDDPESEADEGLRHFNTVKEASGWVPEYFCVDVDSAKLTMSELYARAAGLTVPNGSGTGESIASSVADAAAAKDEAEKRDRRKLVALNKLALAAQEVRRAFVTQLLTRKTLPKGAGLYVAACLAGDGLLLSNYKAAEVTAAMLGADPTGGVQNLIAGMPEGSDARAQVVVLGLVLGALESRTSKDAWRNAKSVTGFPLRHSDVPGYLLFLRAQGYVLSEIEQVIVGELTADQVYDDLLASEG